MKCKRCGNNMDRIKTREHSYAYRCRKCGLTVGQAPKDEKKEENTNRE